MSIFKIKPVCPTNYERIRDNSCPNNFVLYTASDGVVKIGVIIQGETVWLTQQQIADLFGRDRSVITKHLKSIFDSGELEENSVCANFAHTAADGKTYQTKYYNLDAIISVGYRVNSQQATQFRIWATQTLKEYITKGFVLNDERLKQGGQLINDCSLYHCYNQGDIQTS